MEEIIIKKIKKIEKLEGDILVLLEKVQSIFAKDENPYVKKITQGLHHLKLSMGELKDNKNTQNVLNAILLYNVNINVDILLKIINDNFNKLLDKKVNVETFLSQTYVNETREYNEKVQVLFARTRKENEDLNKELLTILGDSISKQIIEQKDVYQSFSEFTDIIQKSPEAALLYKTVANKVLNEVSKQDIQLSFSIMELIEKSKNNILSNLNNKNNVYKYKPTNTFIKNFGLVSNSPLLDIQGISKLVFPKETQPATDIKELKKLCEKLNYDLVLIKKLLNRGINYNVLPLVDMNISKNFERFHKTDDGITEELIQRYSTIEYISETPANWEIKYEYLYELRDNKFVLILEELHHNKYCILSNKLETSEESRNYFTRKNSVKEFLEFTKTQSYQPTRVGNYNEIINKKITENMFLHVKPDIDVLKIKSQVIDPKYLRNEIYVLILSKFKAKYEKKKSKNLYEFSKLIHDEEFEIIFRQIIMNEYIKYLFKNIVVYETENISMSEVYSSFLHIINLYERDFKKKMHDIFLINMPSRDIFKNTSVDKDKVLTELFEKILSDVLGMIVTNESNIFQTILYKLYIFKLSLLD